MNLQGDLLPKLLFTFQFAGMPTSQKSRNIFLLPGRFHGPVFVFPADPDHLRDIQQVVQGIGAVPELMLPPEAGGHRQEQELVDVRANYRAVSGRPDSGPLDCPSPKKPDRLQEIPSSRSFIQDGVSCSSSGQPHSLPVMTGWGPAGRSTET